MRANIWSLCLAIAVFALATIARRSPFNAQIHRWEIALATALAGLFLFIAAARSLRPKRPGEGFAAVGALGGAVIAVAFVAAELLVGPPQRVAAAPGQWYRPPHSAHVAIEFPAVSAATIGRAGGATSVGLRVDARRDVLGVGNESRVHSYVFRAQRWPAAYVEAWSGEHAAQTVTQPNGSAFVSPVLQFPDIDRDGLPIDSFAVPALHRQVRVKYYPGLPQRGIDVPFVQLEIDEENGGALYSGVTVSGRPVRHAGLELVFALGTYPVVSMASAPDTFVYLVGGSVIAVGLIGFSIAVLPIAARRASA